MPLGHRQAGSAHAVRRDVLAHEIGIHSRVKHFGRRLRLCFCEFGIFLGKVYDWNYFLLQNKVQTTKAISHTFHWLSLAMDTDEQKAIAMAKPNPSLETYYTLLLSSDSMRKAIPYYRINTQKLLTKIFFSSIFFVKVKIIFLIKKINYFHL